MSLTTATQSAHGGHAFGCAHGLEGAALYDTPRNASFSCSSFDTATLLSPLVKWRDVLREARKSHTDKLLRCNSDAGSAGLQAQSTYHSLPSASSFQTLIVLS
jgi:hypothetical protein